MAKDAECSMGLYGFEDGEEGEEITIEEDAETEVDTSVKVANDPGKPTERQVVEHRLTHIPYRAWCKWCVMGQ